MTKDDVLVKFKDVVGERNDDVVIDFLDAFDEFTRETQHYEERIREIEEKWKKKYINRFYGKEDEKIEELKETVEDIQDEYADTDTITIDELFEEKEEK